MTDILVYIAIVIGIVARLVLMKGSFVLPTFYKRGDEMSFNLGSISTIIVGIVAALMLMQAQPELFSNWYVAGMTAYTAPQIIDAIPTSIARNSANEAEPEDDELIIGEEDYDDDEVA